MAKGETFSTRQEAIDDVETKKAAYGSGVSTLLILHNDTNDLLGFDDSYSFHGRWEYSPPSLIPKGKFATFLHVKKSGAAVGSMGAATFRLVDLEDADNSKVYVGIGWDSPWGATSTGLGVDISTSSKIHLTESLANGAFTLSEGGFNILGQNLNDHKSPILYFRLSVENE